MDAAKDGRRPSPSAGKRATVLRHLNRRPPKVASTVLGKPTLFPANLEARVMLELAELYEGRPLLRLCTACGFPFVPRRSSQQRCRVGLRERQSGTVLAGCIPSDVLEAAAQAELETNRVRDYKRLHVRAARSRARYGHDHHLKKEAELDLEAWRDHRGRARGRPRAIERIDVMKK
jgi:hypothetical protein